MMPRRKATPKAGRLLKMTIGRSAKKLPAKKLSRLLKWWTSC